MECIKRGDGEYVLKQTRRKKESERGEIQIAGI
jgi:hypothetical protein